jgi:hypothetical protein
MSVFNKVNEAQVVGRGLEALMGTAGVTADQFVKRTPAVKVLLPEAT